MRLRFVALAVLIFLIFSLNLVLELDFKQTISLVVFMGFIFGTLLYWRFRLAFALTGIVILLVLGLIDVPTLVDFSGLDIILFLMGMMIVIGFLEERRFFEYLVDKITTLAGTSGIRLVVVMMILSAFFAALVDEVTSILFMAASMIHLTLRVKMNPVPFIIMLVFATNIGSSATVVGNPVGVLVALRGGLTFADFLRWATPISIGALVIAIPLSTFYYRKEIKMLDERLKLSVESKVKSDDKAHPQSKELWLSALLFIGTITALILHNQIEVVLHLKKNTMLVGTALAAAAIALFIDRERARQLVERRVDWWTLAFFLLLFASVGTLNYVGVDNRIASKMIALPLEETSLLTLFTALASLMSAFMDNVLAVATLLPIVDELGGLGINSQPFYWSALFAGTFFGNLTLIGSTANIVAIGILERRELGHITLKEWIKPGALVSVPTLAVALLLIIIQIPLMT
ncbi:MAG: SLC13 family permease [Nitrososphaerales archaeon]